MVRHQPHTGVSTPATRPSTVQDKSDAFAAGQKLLGYLAGALDTSMLENKHSALVQCEAVVDVAVKGNDSSFLWFLNNTDFFQLLTLAAVNSMNVVLQEVRCSLLDHGKLLSVVRTLWHMVSQCTRQICTPDILRLLPRGREMARQHANESGLMSALTKFTEAAWQALKQLPPDICQHQLQQHQQQQPRPKSKTAAKRKQQQQQQPDYAARHITASLLVDQLLAFWETISICLRLDTELEQTLPLLIQLTARAPTLLKYATDHSSSSGSGSSSSSSSTNLAQARQAGRIRAIAARGVFIASSVAVYLRKQEQPSSELRQQILLTKQLPELLLQLLAHQAGKLYTACGGTSQVMRDCGAATGQSSDQQQQQQQQQQIQTFVVPPNHVILLHSMEVTNGEYMFVCNPCLHESEIYGDTLAALHEVVATRWHAAQLHSDSNNSASPATGQGQQQHWSDHRSLLDLLLVPTIKVLVEMLLLLAPGNITPYGRTLEVLQLLLQTAASPAAAPAVAAAGSLEPAAAPAPWPPLPAAVAAELLHSVLLLLPPAVLQCLLQTDYKSLELADRRSMLLHLYGNVLITVCQSVEAKHIAAVLRPQSAGDLLISLAAVEAVIRAQSCHLAPTHLKQQQQQQQQAQQHLDLDGSSAGYLTWDWVHDITEHPLNHASLLLLPFVSKIVDALEDVVDELYQQQPSTRTIASGDSVLSQKLAARLFTLLSTALKASRCAATAAEADHMAWVQAIANASKISDIARRWFSAAQHTSGSGDGSPLSQAHFMSVVLLFKALELWACGWFAIMEQCEVMAAAQRTHGSAAAPGGRHGASSDDLTRCPQTLKAVLGSVVMLFDHASEVVHVMAAKSRDHVAGAAGAAAAAAAEPHQQQSSNHCLEGKHEHCGQLQPFMEQCRRAKEGLRSTLQRAVIEVVYGSPDEVALALASMSYEELRDNLLPKTEVVQPSTCMFESMKHSSTLIRGLANAVVSWYPLVVCCNNPACTNLSKLSEWQLVCGKACVCAGCGITRYCSRRCQEQHWKLHKPVCSRLSAL